MLRHPSSSLDFSELLCVGLGVLSLGHIYVIVGVFTSVWTLIFDMVLYCYIVSNNTHVPNVSLNLSCFQSTCIQNLYCHMDSDNTHVPYDSLDKSCFQSTCIQNLHSYMNSDNTHSIWTFRSIFFPVHLHLNLYYPMNSNNTHISYDTLDLSCFQSSCILYL